MIESIKKIMEPLKYRVMLMIGRCVILATDDSKNIQIISGSFMASELKSGIPKIDQYGLSARPLPGAEAVVVFLGGNRENGIVIATEDRRYRVKNLAEGEICLYTDEGDKIHFKRGNLIEVTTGTLTVNAASVINLNAPDVNINSLTLNIQATDEVNITTDQLNISSGYFNAGPSGLSVTGDINATEDISDANGSMQEIRDTYNGHTHGAGPGPSPLMT